MTPRTRACHISLDYSGVLCTTHGSHSREGSAVGLDTYRKTTSESSNPSVSQASCPGQGVEMAHRAGGCASGPGENFSPASLGHARLNFVSPALGFLTENVK